MPRPALRPADLLLEGGIFRNGLPYFAQEILRQAALDQPAPKREAPAQPALLPSQAAAFAATARELLIRKEPGSGASYLLRRIAVARASAGATVLLVSPDDRSLLDHLDDRGKATSLWRMVEGEPCDLTSGEVKWKQGGGSIKVATWESVIRRLAAPVDVVLLDDIDEILPSLFQRLRNRAMQAPVQNGERRPCFIAVSPAPVEDWIVTHFADLPGTGAVADLVADEVPSEFTHGTVRRITGEVSKFKLADLPLFLWPKQQAALDTSAAEVLYGGAGGAGKSFLIRVAAITWAHEIQGLQVYIFRRELPDLLKNHMEGPSSFPALLAPWIDAKYAKINWSKNLISIGKSRIHLCSCQHEKDVYGYQGSDIHVLIIDELTQFSDSIYRYLRSRVRLAKAGTPLALTMPPGWEARFPRILAGSNPGGIGHNAAKVRFIDPAPKMEIWRAPKVDGGMLRQFIPAALQDNPALDEDEYAAKLYGLPEYLRRAMLDGDWNIVAGGMLDDLWRDEVHIVQPFDIPSSWTIDRSLDWGMSKPASVGWWAESDGTFAVMKTGQRRQWPRGTLFRIGEIYTWNGNPNEGTKILAAELGREILEYERTAGIAGRVRNGPADPSIFAVEEGKSFADKFAAVGVRWIAADNSPGSRKAGAESLREMLKAACKRPQEEPGLFIFETCRQWLRTVPVIPRDLKKPDDADTKAEDHAYDETRYRIRAPKRGGGGAVAIPWS